jgi:hypothetical protein
MGEIPSTTTSRIMETLYRVHVNVDGMQLHTTLIHATSKAAAIAKAQQEPVTIRPPCRVTYTAFTVTTA